MELSLDVSDSRNKVNSASSDDHGWLCAKSSASSSVNILRGNSINLVSIFVESKISVGEEILSNFF